MFFFRKSAVLRVSLTRFMNYMFLYPFEYRAMFEANCYTDWRPIHIVFYTNPTPTPTWECLWQYRSRELKTLRSLCCWVNFFWSFSSESNWKFSLRRTFCRMRLWRWRLYCVFIGINFRFGITNVWPGPSKNNVNVVEISKILGSWQSVNVRVVDKCVNWILKVIPGQETSELRANNSSCFRCTASSVCWEYAATDLVAAGEIISRDSSVGFWVEKEKVWCVLCTGMKGSGPE